MSCCQEPLSGYLALLEGQKQREWESSSWVESQYRVPMAVRAAEDSFIMARSQGTLLYMTDEIFFTWSWVEARSSHYHKLQAID